MRRVGEAKVHAWARPSSLVGLHYAVIGGGMQGRAAAADLAGRPDTAAVMVLDIKAPPAGTLGRNTIFSRADLVKAPELAGAAILGADACIVALPGAIAAGALPALLNARVPIVDMSFTPEVRDRALDRAAMAAGVPLLRDVGVAPGLSHLLAADAAASLRGLDVLTIYVGGIPKTPPSDPFRHAVYFNAPDLIAEYIRPARMRRNGEDVAPHPLDPAEWEGLGDRQLGALEAFPSDGLRSLLDSYPGCASMRELTLRWPGHLEYMRGRASRGDFGDSSREGRTPLTDAAADLAERFPGESHPDWLLMEVHADFHGKHLASRVLAEPAGGLSAMSRSTAFTAAAAAHALAQGKFKKPGLHPPEVMGGRGAMRDGVISDLRERGIVAVSSAGITLERPAPAQGGALADH